MGTIQINEKKVVRELDLVSGDITLEVAYASNEEVYGKFLKAPEEEEGEPVELGGINFNGHRTIFWKPVEELNISDEDLLTCLELAKRAFTLNEN